MIYAIRCGQDGPIKLGRGNDPAKRIKNLQVGNPEVLTLLAYQETQDDDATEKGLHKLLSKWHVHGEWFAPNQTVLDVVRCVQSGQADRLLNLASAYASVQAYKRRERKAALVALYCGLKRLVAIHAAA